MGVSDLGVSELGVFELGMFEIGSGAGENVDGFILMFCLGRATAVSGLTVVGKASVSLTADEIVEFDMETGVKRVGYF